VEVKLLLWQVFSRQILFESKVKRKCLIRFQHSNSQVKNDQGQTDLIELSFLLKGNEQVMLEVLLGDLSQNIPGWYAEHVLNLEDLHVV
jgi:hypothetical protein